MSFSHRLSSLSSLTPTHTNTHDQPQHARATTTTHTPIHTHSTHPLTHHTTPHTPPPSPSLSHLHTRGRSGLMLNMACLVFPKRLFVPSCLGLQVPSEHTAQTQQMGRPESNGRLRRVPTVILRQSESEGSHTHQSVSFYWMRCASTKRP